MKGFVVIVPTAHDADATKKEGCDDMIIRWFDDEEIIQYANVLIKISIVVVSTVRDDGEAKREFGA